MIQGNVKMFDLVQEHPRILLVLEHFRIPLGFGDDTISEICQQYQINEALFLTISNLFCCKEEVIPLKENFGKSEARQIIEFLKTAHIYYLEEKLPRLQSMIEEKVKEIPNEIYSKMIKKFINDYATEVKEHIKYENTIVFPYVESLLNDKVDSSKFTILTFKQHHTNIEDKLSDLTHLLLKHIPSEYDSVLRRKMLFELYSLEEDISVHDFIENHILIPIVERLELSTR